VIGLGDGRNNMKNGSNWIREIIYECRKVLVKIIIIPRNNRCCENVENFRLHLIFLDLIMIIILDNDLKPITVATPFKT
jgi:hypothetical protein